MPGDLIVTREIAPLPERRDDAHKGEVGRIVIIGGSCDEVLMIGAPALTANAAFRSGAGLVQLFVPAALRESVCVLAPCATTRSLPTTADAILDAARDFAADFLVVGPGLGRSLAAQVVVDVLNGFGGAAIVDADALNLLSTIPDWGVHDPHRVVLTPHPGELRRLLSGRGIDRTIEGTPQSRRAAACALVEATGCTVVLKGRGTIVTNGDRIYTNETGNSGMATAGAGDVLSGVIAALIGQRMEPFEAAILGVYLHGLAGDFAAEELGRWSMTAFDIIDYLPEAFGEHEASEAE